MEEIFHLWVYLAASPLLWLAATLAAFLLADGLSVRLGRPAWAHPVLVSVLLLGALLTATATRYETYFQGAQFVHFMLGPATVALAVPLVRERALVRRMLVPLLAGLLAGSLTAIVSAVGIAMALGASRDTVLSLAPKSVTTPIAMAVASQIGGMPALTACFVVLTGIIGAVSLGPLFRLVPVRGAAAKGLAAGVASHGIGTAQAFTALGGVAGSFAGLGLALNGLATSLLVPLLARLLPHIGP